jgi:ArsR family transcriptional regulator, arsenate/arsenite/antimonite-responsive transcriptional repressor / arsenate reductase (thioredoxin)
VLFVCTGNSARSQLAQAITEHMAGDAVTAASAGSRPRPLHPHAVTVMREQGIGISGRRPRHLDEFSGQRFGYVISLCDKVREVCPEFPGPPEVIHWSIPDPAAGDGTLPAFRAVAADLRTRIGFLLARISDEAR